MDRQKFKVGKKRSKSRTNSTWWAVIRQTSQFIETHIECQLVELSILLNLLDVIDRQADEQVHHHDAHHEDEDNEEEVGVVLKRRRIVSRIVREKRFVFQFSHHHHKGLDQGPGRVGKEGLNGKLVPNGVF